MKPLILLILSASLSYYSLGQNSFTINIEEPLINYISDVTEETGHYYFIQNRVRDHNPLVDNSSICDLLITDFNGVIVDKLNVGGTGVNYQRILKISGEDIYLVGYLTGDTCLTKMVISKFNLQTHQLEHLSTYDMCNYSGVYLNLVNGLSEKLFIEEYHYENMITYRPHKELFEIDPAYNINSLPEELTAFSNFSIDFARTGYVVIEGDLCNFYTSSFTYRKQRYSNDQVTGDHQTHIPFGNFLILENAIKPTSFADGGMQVRLLDSALHVRNKAVIVPNHGFQGIDLPLHGGVAIKNQNEVWVSGIFGRSFSNTRHTFFSITKLDSNLNVICQQFIGYDAIYDIYGIKSLVTGGAIAYGSRVRNGLDYNGGEDIYAIKIGENCELTTTSTDGPDQPLISISAYPNPGLNNLTFHVNGFDPSALHVELINEMGQVLFKKQDLSYSIQVPELPAGQYFYRILQNERLLGVGSWVKQ